MRWFTSDTHFGHERILGLCNRPFDTVEDMNEGLIDNWNSVVAPEDTVYHLGDVALGPWVQWDDILTRLNGHKVLVVGNHDRIFALEKERMRHRFEPLYHGWFDQGMFEHLTALELSNGMQVNLSHFPYNGDSHDGDRFDSMRMLDMGRVLLHGHTHSDKIFSRSAKGTLQVHVGVDAWNYTPVSEDQIITLIESQE